jgi:alpha-D-xyloside xylohydrolase
VYIRRAEQGIEAQMGQEVVRIQSWGPDALRVRVGLREIDGDLPGALDEPPEIIEPTVRQRGDDSLEITNGAITAVVTTESGDSGRDGLALRFLGSATGEELLAEQPAHFWWPGSRVFSALGGGRYRLEQHFRAYDDERLFGLGQRTHGRLDQKGMALDLVQRNGEVSIPFLLSSRGYGLLWNNPAVGHVELAANRTRWVAGSARQIDYWITAGSPSQILGRYADVTGHAPILPEWATGFWQSKLRYRTQEELLEVAREYRRRSIPLSVIVADFFHWPALGDWRFDPVDWPDPRAMVDELQAMGTRLMVSIWPLVSPLSENFSEMAKRGLLVGSERGPAYLTEFAEKGIPTHIGVALYDPTNPEARAFIWERVCENYLRHGIRVWWLDACEPELRPMDAANLRFHVGSGDEVVNLYPLLHARAFHDGMLAAGEREVVLLTRSAWAGSQRYGAAVWSGDIPATFDSLRRQVRAGLNIALSGIPWWTTDIGGFHGGDPTDPAFRELIVRWFQYGAFCPLFRLHGDRLPRSPTTAEMTGGDNEIWSFGDETLARIEAVLAMRERIRPYLHAQMVRAHEDGTPPMRPLFVDFPEDLRSWTAEDEFLLGPDVLVAPVVEAGARQRNVYLPPGLWTHAWSGVTSEGPTEVRIDAPLDQIPVFLRSDAQVPVAG